MKKLLLILLLITFVSSALDKDSENQLKFGKKFLDKGYVTKAEFEQYKKELNVDTKSIPYSKFNIYSSFQLVTFDLFEPEADGYKLAEMLTWNTASKLIVRFIKEQNKVTNNDYFGYLKSRGAVVTKGAKASANLSYEEYAVLFLSVFGYNNYTPENVKKVTVQEGMQPGKYGTKTISRGLACSFNLSSLNIAVADSYEMIKTKLLKKGVLGKKVFSDYEKWTYEGRFKTKDNMTETMWKFSRKYDFVRYNDYHHGPRPIHGSLKWPDKGIELRYVGNIKIADHGHSWDEKLKVAKEMMQSLNIPEHRIKVALEKINKREKFQHIDYYWRGINIKANKSKTRITFDFYMEK